MTRCGRHRARRWAGRQHAQVELERRAVARREPERVEAHQPEHPTGCLRCLIARTQGDES